MAKEKNKLTWNAQLISNIIATRTELLKSLLDDKKNIDDECGYPTEISPAQYKALYDREGIGTRVVQVYPEESWAEDPEIYETEEQTETAFEEAWDKLLKEKNLYHFLERIDELSGIGRFGVLLLGLDDGKDLREPVEGINPDGTFTKKVPANRKLLYLRTFDESVVTIQSVETDIKNPRYHQPTMYEIKFIDPLAAGVSTMQSLSVHWTRVIHVADNRKTSEVFGVPRIQNLYNRLYDLRKILSGSGEMFWKGAFPGYSFEVNPDLSDVEIDKEAMRAEFEKYSNGLQRYLALTGVTAKSLSPQVSDPTAHVNTHMRIIAIAMGVPTRVLFGSEEAKLASSQDIKTWNKRLKRRQDKYLTPMLLRPFVDRLMALGVLPFVETYEVEWPDLNTVTDEDKANVAGLQTDALSKYVAGGVDQVIPPLEFLTSIMGMELEEAEAILDAATEWVASHPQEPMPMPGDPNAGGFPPKKKQPQEKAPVDNMDEFVMQNTPEEPLPPAKPEPMLFENKSSSEK